jgi:fumarate hydratase, class II
MTTTTASEIETQGTRKETDSLGAVDVPVDKLWGAQTQRSLEHFSIGKDLIPREMITSYAILKKAAAIANHDSKRLDDRRYGLIVQTCDEILAGQHHDMFPLHVWMTGSGTQFNMNVNEVISNRCCQLAGTPLGSKTPVHPNDHVNMAQSSNDSFPSAMYIAAAGGVKQRLVPSVTALRDAIDNNSRAWKDIVKIGRTHMQDATPLTLGQEWSGYVGMLETISSASSQRLLPCTVWRWAAQPWARASTRRQVSPRRRLPKSVSSQACPL